MIFPNIMNIINKIIKRLFKNRKLKELVGEFSERKFGSFLFIIHLNKPRVLILPANFDPKGHILTFNPVEYGFPADTKFNIEKMKYFLGLLSSIPANNKDLITENGYVPIHSTTIRNNIKDYLHYVNYLINTGVVVTDGIYDPGVKSKGFKWTEQYENADFVIYSQVEVAENVNIENNVYEEIDNYPYLNYWYKEKKLSIDLPLALRYAKNMKEFKMQNRSRWDYNADKGCLKYPINQYHSILYNLGALNKYDYKPQIDKNVHRLHSTITNMQKDYRNFFKYNNESLVSIDITNSQPYLTCALFNPQFWKDNSNLTLNIKSLPLNIQSRFNEFSISIMIGNFFNKLKLTEFNEYAQIVSAGRMYEALIDIVRVKRGDEIPRKIAKTTMFSIFFSKNRGAQNNPNKDLMDIFRLKFPAVAELFKIIKHSFKGGGDDQHSRLACLLQSIESEIILHRCCKRIWEEGQQRIPVFTIHDSIVTTVNNLEFVKRIMVEELTRNIGIAPNLTIELWNESNLNPDFLR